MWFKKKNSTENAITGRAIDAALARQAADAAMGEATALKNNGLNIRSTNYDLSTGF